MTGSICSRVYLALMHHYVSENDYRKRVFGEQRLHVIQRYVPSFRHDDLLGLTWRSGCVNGSQKGQQKLQYVSMCGIQCRTILYEYKYIKNYFVSDY